MDGLNSTPPIHSAFLPSLQNDLLQVNGDSSMAPGAPLGLAAEFAGFGQGGRLVAEGDDRPASSVEQQQQQIIQVI
jgi:hypothetical protein